RSDHQVNGAAFWEDNRVSTTHAAYRRQLAVKRRFSTASPRIQSHTVAPIGIVFPLLGNGFADKYLKPDVGRATPRNGHVEHIRLVGFHFDGLEHTGMATATAGRQDAAIVVGNKGYARCDGELLPSA